MTSAEYRLQQPPCKVSHAKSMWCMLEAHMSLHQSSMSEAEHELVSEQLDNLYSVMTTKRKGK